MCIRYYADTPQLFLFNCVNYNHQFQSFRALSGESQLRLNYFLFIHEKRAISVRKILGENYLVVKEKKSGKPLTAFILICK